MYSRCTGTAQYKVLFLLNFTANVLKCHPDPDVMSANILVRP